MRQGTNGSEFVTIEKVQTASSPCSLPSQKKQTLLPCRGEETHRCLAAKQRVSGRRLNASLAVYQSVLHVAVKGIVADVGSASLEPVDIDGPFGYVEVEVRVFLIELKGEGHASEKSEDTQGEIKWHTGVFQ